MRMRNDSRLFNFDSRYLGPKGFTLPVAPRYAAIIVGAGIVFFPVMVALHKLGVERAGLVVYLLVGVVCTVGITTAIGHRFSPERPFRCVLADFRKEVGCARPGRAVIRMMCVPDLLAADARRYRWTTEGLRERFGR